MKGIPPFHPKFIHWLICSSIVLLGSWPIEAYGQYTIEQLETLFDKALTYAEPHQLDSQIYYMQLVYDGSKRNQLWETAAGIGGYISALYIRKKQWRDATYYARRMLEILDVHNIRSRELRAVAFLRIAETHKSQGKEEEAMQVLLKIELEKLSVDGFRTTHLTYHLLGIGIAAGRMDAEEAAMHFDQLIEKGKLPEDILLVFDAYNEMGKMYEQQGKFNWALSYYQKALQLIQTKPPSNTALAAAHYNIGYLLYHLGRLDTAMQMFQQALDMYSGGQVKPSVKMADVYNTMGLVYAGKGENDKAQAFYQACLSIYVHHLGKDHLHNAVIHANIADVIMHKGISSKRVFNHLLEAKRIYENHGDVGEVGKTNLQIGYAYALRGEIDKASWYADLGLSHVLTHFGTNNFTTAKAYARAGEIYAQVDRPQAKLMADTAISMMLALSPPQNLQVIRTALLAASLSCSSTPDYKNYVELIIEGSTKPGYEITAAQPPKWSEIIFPHLLAMGTSLLADNYAHAGDRLKARAWFDFNLALLKGIKQQAVLTEDGLTRQAMLADAYDRYIAFYWQQWKTTENPKDLQSVLIASDFARTNLIEEIRWQNKLFSQAENAQLAEQITDSRNKLIQLQAAHALQLQEDNVYLHANKIMSHDILECILDQEECWSQLPSSLSSYTVLELDSEAIQSRLQSDEVMIQYHLIGDTLLLTVVISKETIHTRQVFLYQPLSKQISAFRSAIQKGPPAAIQDLAKSLHAACIEDVLPLIAEKKLIIIPHKSLYLLPFHALQDKNGKYLVEGHPISYHLAASLWLETSQLRGKPRKGDIQLWAPISFEDPEFETLPFSADEVERIQKFCKGEAHTLEYAQEKYFRERAPQARFIHLATHAQVHSEHWMQTHIALNGYSQHVENDGRLYMHEIAQLKLKAELIYLNACNSGIGLNAKNEDVIGLPRAFLLAGIPTVIGSYWPVSDAASAEYSETFYRQLRQGKTAAEALQAVQIHFIEHADPALRNPNFWAGMALIGQADMQWQRPSILSAYHLRFAGIALFTLLMYSLVRRLRL